MAANGTEGAFYHSWAECAAGFGTLGMPEYWIGNQKLYAMTSSANYSLFIDIQVNSITVCKLKSAIEENVETILSSPAKTW